VDAYADFIDELSAGGFATPGDGGPTAEQIAALVARNHEELITVTEAVLAGARTRYDNTSVADPRELARYVTAYGNLRGLADRIAETVTVLRDLGGQLGARAGTLVPVRVVEDGAVLVDQPLPWGKLLELDEQVYVPRHLDQLRALRPSC
jgi:hypothetical protein